jgi:hypothetical protein
MALDALHRDLAHLVRELPQAFQWLGRRLEGALFVADVRAVITLVGEVQSQLERTLRSIDGWYLPPDTELQLADVGIVVHQILVEDERYNEVTWAYQAATRRALQLSLASLERAVPTPSTHHLRQHLQAELQRADDAPTTSA